MPLVPLLHNYASVLCKLGYLWLSLTLFMFTVHYFVFILCLNPVPDEDKLMKSWNNNNSIQFLPDSRPCWPADDIIAGVCVDGQIKYGLVRTFGIFDGWWAVRLWRNTAQISSMNKLFIFSICILK